MNDTVRRYAASAAHMDWITESRYRELTGEDIQTARTAINRAPEWPAALQHSLTRLLDTLEADTADHITLSNMNAFSLAPVTITRDVARPDWTVVSAYPQGALAVLNHPTPQLITAVLNEWHIQTPPCAWDWPVTPT